MASTRKESGLAFASGIVSRLFGRKARKKGKPKVDDSTRTGISQTLEQVIARLREDKASNILVIGNLAFLDQFKSVAPELSAAWGSCAFSDIERGAINADEADFSSASAVVCGGPDVVAGYRLALARMAETDASKPIHWVGQNWEFCGGTSPVPIEADECEALLFNHFLHYFAIKDNLQFRIDIYCGAQSQHFYRIMRPGESLVLRMSDYFPNRKEPAAFATFVSHPFLTRGRHYRLRVCADIFWKDSLTTLHGMHEFNRSPNHKFEFRVSSEMARSGKLILTVPNYARDIGQDDQLTTWVDGQASTRSRDRSALIEQDSVPTEVVGNSRYVGWNYRGYGGSNLFVLQPGKGAHGRGTIAANHHASVPIEALTKLEMATEEKEDLARLGGAGYLIDSYSMPVFPHNSDLRFGFDCDSANPPFQDFILHRFSSSGQHLGTSNFRKEKLGRIFTDELPGVAEDTTVASVVVAPDFERIGVRRKGFKVQFDFVIENRSTGDWDMTEGQSCWRNVGAIVPGTAHFAGPAGAVIGRTNLFARARAGGGWRTAVLANHASGRLKYKRAGTLTVAVSNLKGETRSVTLEVPGFTWKLIDLDEVWPDLGTFLAPDGLGALLATSTNADINCQIVTMSTAGAVSLQHMWGY